MADVFISYKSDRRAAAQHLARILELNGYSVWFDYALSSGSDFGQQIERELRAAKAVVVLWCSLSRDSPWVIEEAHLAEKLGTFTPIWLERVDPPLGFGRADTIDLSDWDGAPRSHRLDRLLNEVARRVGCDPVQQFRGLQEYEETWRSFGAPALTRFALASPVAACEQQRLPDADDVRGRRPVDSATRARVSAAPAAAAARVKETQAAIAAVAGTMSASRRAASPPLPLWRDVLRYGLAPFVVLLTVHYAVVNSFNLDTVYLRLDCVVVPFAAGFALFWIGRRGVGAVTLFALALGLFGTAAMSVSESLYSGDPMLPHTRFEWIDNFQFAGTIILSYIAGHLLARMAGGLLSRRRLKNP